ncbi:MAG: hypothetical protein IK121_10085, partial [Lachnospiraceae bacterium]|nr:hypothetical protein [Lachnospiraceae bacterium]
KTNKVTVFDSPVEGSVKTEAEFKAVKYLSRENLTEVEVLLFTGKTHQIRAELNYLGFPVAGDVKYTDNTGNVNSSGHCLIAYRLVFPELPEYAALSCREFKIDTSDYLNKFINSRG